MVSVLFFDFSETLVHGELDVPACRRSVVDFLSSSGHRISKMEYEYAIEASLEWRRSKRQERLEITSEEFERKTLKKLGIESTDRLIRNIERIEFKHYNWKLFPRVQEILEDLHHNYRLGIISNSSSTSVIQVLRQKLLFNLFDPIVLSRDVGFRKPDPKIFEYALDLAGVNPVDAIFIGDSFMKDILGAKNVGMRTIWIMHHGAESLSPSSDGIATNFAEIPKLVAEVAEASLSNRISLTVAEPKIALGRTAGT